MYEIYGHKRTILCLHTANTVSEGSAKGTAGAKDSKNHITYPDEGELALQTPAWVYKRILHTHVLVTYMKMVYHKQVCVHVYTGRQ